MDVIDQLLTRGVDKIYPSRKALENVLRSGKKLRLYFGVDPSGDALHIGHAVALRKLHQFQKLGHHVILLIGDFTGMIGDPSGKKEGRRQLTRDQVLTNAKEYKTQASKILEFEGENAVEIKFNSTWLSKLSFEEILKLAARFTIQQILERDMFQERIKRGDDIGLHEFLYPLMQGYDSVAMNVDLEIGGTDQMFNMLAGRKLVSQILHKEKFVMTVPLLTDAKGVKIGKTEGNVIGITDPANDFFGKIMALGDDAVVPCFTLLTDFSLEEIERLKVQLRPIDFKKKLAFELTKQFNSQKDAEDAQNEFELVYQQKKTEEVSAEEINATGKTILEVLTKTGLSKSEAKRLLEQKAIEINSKVLTNDEIVSSGDIIKVGKKKFLKLV